MDLILAQEQVLRFVPPFAPWEGQLSWVQGRRLADTRAPSGTHRAVPFFPLLLQGRTPSAPSLRPHRSGAAGNGCAGSSSLSPRPHNGPEQQEGPQH